MELTIFTSISYIEKVHKPRLNKKVWKEKIVELKTKMQLNITHSALVSPGWPVRLSSTISGNREMGQLYTKSQVSNITKKTIISHISWQVFKIK